jgi:hypothetical protein
MLTREQLHAFLCMRKKGVTFFSTLPRDIIPYMRQVAIGVFNPDSEIAILLHHIAFGDLQSAKAMLKVNPRLVLQASHVETPSGLKVMHTTPLECALGAGDPEMVKMIAPFFEARGIAGGVSVRTKQFASYRMHIENMMTQEPYDFTLLLHTLMLASPADVVASLNNNMTHDSALRDILIQFRKDFTPDTITVGMHFNYQHLLHAVAVYNQCFDILHSYGHKYDKNRLFCCQVIGFIQRSLPAIDRMIFAQGFYNVSVENAGIKRSFKFKDHDFNFPVTAGDYSFHGLGFDYFAGWVGGRRVGGSLMGMCTGFERLMTYKHARLAELVQQLRVEKTWGCVMC